MPNHKVTRDELQEAVDMYAACGNNEAAAARRMGMKRMTYQHRRICAIRDGILAQVPVATFEATKLPDGEDDVVTLLERRSKEFRKRDIAEQARKLIDVKVKLHGPIGILHFGDPHVDDDGCDLPSLRHHVELCNTVEGLFGANVGDLQNNWVGRLSHLWGEQSTSKRQAWQLTEWLVSSVQWLYLVGGNHDAWSGSGDPLLWMTRNQLGVFDYDKVRINLIFPNGKQVRINARHQYRGHSMWNNTHGLLRAASMGWRDHILACGHIHTSGYQMAKDPMSGMISHLLRLAGYKRHDHYAKQHGFDDGTISPAALTIIDPTQADTSPGLITVFHDIDMGVRFLKMLRADYKRRAARLK